MKGFIGLVGAVLLIVGIVNVTSDISSTIGWICAVLGIIFLPIWLSGPYKKTSNHKDSTASGGNGYLDPGDGGGGSD